jgi:hypothetical protein
LTTLREGLACLIQRGFETEALPDEIASCSIKVLMTAGLEDFGVSDCARVVYCKGYDRPSLRLVSKCS